MHLALHPRNHAPCPGQLCLFPKKTETPYMRRASRLLWSIRKQHIDTLVLEEGIIDLGIFESEEDINLLVAHTAYDSPVGKPITRDAFLRGLGRGCERELQLLADEGYGRIHHVREAIRRKILTWKFL